MSNSSKTDWSRIDAMTDEEIDTSDVPPLDDQFFAKAEFRMPAAELSVVAVPCDAETLIWFQSKGQAAEQHMTAALKIYAESQKQVAAIQQAS